MKKNVKNKITILMRTLVLCFSLIVSARQTSAGERFWDWEEDSYDEWGLGREEIADEPEFSPHVIKRIEVISSSDDAPENHYGINVKKTYEFDKNGFITSYIEEETNYDSSDIVKYEWVFNENNILESIVLDIDGNIEKIDFDVIENEGKPECICDLSQFGIIVESYIQAAFNIQIPKSLRDTIITLQSSSNKSKLVCENDGSFQRMVNGATAYYDKYGREILSVSESIDSQDTDFVYDGYRPLSYYNNDNFIELDYSREDVDGNEYYINNISTENTSILRYYSTADGSVMRIDISYTSNAENYDYHVEEKRYYTYYDSLIPDFRNPEDTSENNVSNKDDLKTDEIITYNHSYALYADGTLIVYDSDALDGTQPWNTENIPIKSVVIEDGITNIGDFAFSGSWDLIEVTIPGSIKSIGTGAFYECSSLKSFELSDPSDYYAVFDGVLFNKQEKSIVCYPAGKYSSGYIIPDGIRTINPYAFSCSYTLARLTIPESVIDIGDYAFQSDYSLNDITIPEGITTIGAHTFENCQSLTNIYIPESVTSIGCEAANCQRS